MVSKSASGAKDLFVGKLTTDGNFAWIKQGFGSGGTTIITPTDIKIDSSGTIFIGGYFSSGPALISGGGSYQNPINNYGSTRAFISKVSFSGEWIHADFPTDGISKINGLTLIDSNPNEVYVVGSFLSGVYFSGQGYRYSYNNQEDFFMGKYSGSSNLWTWVVNQSETSGNDRLVDIDSHVSGGNNYLYVLGTTNSGSFSLGNAHIDQYYNRDNIFVAEFRLSGASGEWQWAKAGSPVSGYGLSGLSLITSEKTSGRQAYITARSMGYTNPSPSVNLSGAFYTSVAYSGIGTNGTWGITQAGEPISLTLTEQESTNNIYVLAKASGGSWVVPGTSTTIENGQIGIFEIGANQSGTATWAKSTNFNGQLYSSHYEIGSTIEVANDGNIYVTGLISGSGDINGIQINTNGNKSAFIWKTTK